MQKQKKLSQHEVIQLERDLAKYANMMDSVVRIPFTKQGVGADAALSTIPIAGDAAGFVCFAVDFKYPEDYAADGRIFMVENGINGFLVKDEFEFSSILYDLEKLKHFSRKKVVASVACKFEASSIINQYEDMLLSV